MLPDVGAIYSDRDTEKMSEKRRHFARGALANALVCSTLTILAFLDFYANAWAQSSAEERITIVVVTGVLLFLIISIIYRFQFVRDRNKFRFGIALTPQKLRLFDEAIPVRAIIRAESIWLKASGTYLAIDYSTDKRRKRKIRTILLSGNDTENIYNLRDRLRDLKQWPKQEDTPMYALRRWKKERDILLRDEIALRGR